VLISASLAVVAVSAILVQWLTMPSTLLPLLLGIVGLVAAAVIGLAMGSRLYRVAVVLALAAVLFCAAAIMVPLDRGAAGPRPSPTRGQIVLALGLGLAALSTILGAVALWRRPAWSSGSDSASPHTGDIRAP
jgi:hypothetical protein